MALIIQFAVIPTTISAIAAEYTVDATLDCYETSKRYYTWNSENGCFEISNSTADKGFVIGFEPTVFNNYNIIDITYSFEGSTGEFKTASYIAFWGTRKLTTFRFGSEDDLPENTVSKGNYVVINSSTKFSVKDEQLKSIKENGCTYLYLIHGSSSTELNSNGTIVPKITFTYTVDEPEGALTTDAVSTLAEVSIRLNNQNGIRFYTTVDEEKLAELVGENEYEIGTLIGPADALGEDGELTESDYCIEVKYTARNDDGIIDYFNPDNKEIAGSIVSIKETNNDKDDTNGNIDRDFAGRAYVKVINGDEATYYFSAATSIRSLAYVAYAYKNSESYILNENVEKWAAEYVVPAA